MCMGTNNLMLDFQTGVPAKPALWGMVKHHFDDKFIANKGIDY